MKKIAFLMAIVGMASAETLTFNVTRSDDDVQFNLSEDPCVLSLAYDCWAYNGTGNCEEGAWQTPTNSNYTNTFSPSAQLCSGSTDCWTLNFKVTNNCGEAISLSQFTFEVYGINGGGSDKYAAPTVVMTLTSDDLSVSSERVQIGISGNTATATLNLTDVTLSANQTLSLALSMGSCQSYNTYSGIKSGSVTYSALSVPEPATATLSLLALAGLAVRRRRK